MLGRYFCLFNERNNLCRRAGQNLSQVNNADRVTYVATLTALVPVSESRNRILRHFTS